MAISTEDLRAAYLLGRNSNNELTPDMLQKKGWTTERVLRVFNTLVEKRLCAYHKNKVTGKVRVRVREEEIAHVIRVLSADDYAVYCAIEDAGNTGIWTQDICRTTGLQSHVVQRAVKALCEQKKLIKPLKSIHQKSRKIYILANIEPAKEVVGGTFYDNAEFDEGLVERVREQVIHVLKNGNRASLNEMSNYIRSSGFGRDLGDSDFQLVIKTLQLEQRIQVSVNPATGELMYSWSRWPEDDNWFAGIPCGSCPVADECVRKGGCRVTPSTCQYYDRWLGYYNEEENQQEDGAQEEQGAAR